MMVNVRPRLNSDRFFVSFPPPQRFCTVSSEQVENKEGKRITNMRRG
jgi:hypothetical protein